MQLPAVHGVLRPPVAGEQAPRFGIDVVPVQSDERPFFRLNADAIELLRADAEIIELTHSIRLQVDPDTERLQCRDRLEHDARHTDLFECQRDTQTTDAAAGNEGRKIRHPIPGARTDAAGCGHRFLSTSVSE